MGRTRPARSELMPPGTPSTDGTPVDSGNRHSRTATRQTEPVEAPFDAARWAEENGDAIKLWKEWAERNGPFLKPIWDR